MIGGDDAKWRVFVSHTSELRDFPVGESYVDAVERAISACGHAIVNMADFPAADLPPAQLCRDRVHSCDVYVGVLGVRYGSPVPDRPELSYTELEFDAATEAEGLERLIFLLDTGARDVGIPLDQLMDLEFGARQLAFRDRVGNSGLVTQKFSSPQALGRLVERSLRDLAERRRQTALLEAQGRIRPASRVISVPAAGSTKDNRARLQTYLEELAKSYQWLELQGILEAGSLRIELEKVYVALKAEPESDYDLHHLANLHSLEVREAAGGTSLDSIEPARLEALDAENVRRTYQPRKDEARRATVTDVTTIADAVRQYHRMVLLGGPGSGKTTLGHWLALQLARGRLQQLPREVAPEDLPAWPDVARIHVPAGATTSFSKHHLAPLAQSDKITAIRIDVLPARGTLALSGAPVTVGQIVKVDQIERLTFTPGENECGDRYAHLQFSGSSDMALPISGAIVIDVGIHIRVPVSQVDPDHYSSESPEQLVDLGPARVPVFLRLAHFARELARREREQEPALSLDEYLGCDPDSCSLKDGCTPESRNALLRGFLERQEAVIILDGLDELPEANRRTVSLKIQDFIERTTSPNAADESQAPWQAGGNQVVVTSRYVGYKLMPIRGGCVHFGIQAMQRPAVEHFARAWTAAVNAELGGDAQGRLAAEALIGEIYDDSRPAIRELATNPLLVTILATVYWADGRLPDQRAGVYDRVVENLLRIWLNRPECRAHSLEREELLAALEPLAAELQENAGSNGLISLDRIRELIEKPLALMRKSTPGDRSFRPVLNALLTTIRKQVGLLAEQSTGNYAFFHRTFQEFFAARDLLSDPEFAAEKIAERLDDPPWREPLLLALGLVMISPEWGGPQARTQLLEDVLAADDRNPLIPRAAMLVINALPDLTNVPSRVVQRVVRQLLGCYAFSQDQSQAEGLREGICEAFVKLLGGPQADLISEAISEAIRSPGDPDYSGAAAEVMLRIRWFTTGTVDALLQVVHRDQAELGWPVRWALLAALGQPAGDLPWLGPAPALNTSRLLASHLPMRRLLESSTELTAFVRSDAGWLWLMIALYGGLGHAQIGERLRAHRRKRLRELQADPDDPVEEKGGLPPPVPPVEFCPGDIVHDLADAELSRTIQRHLSMRRQPGELAETFRRVWERDGDPAGSAEAVVGLAALGEDVVPLVRAALTERGREPAARAALARFRWLKAFLQEPLLRSAETAARTIPDQAPEERQLDLLRVVIEARAACGGDPLQVSDTVPSCRFVAATSARVRDAVDAERWAYVFSGLSFSELSAAGPDGALLGIMAESELSSPARLTRGWSELSQARNLLARLRLPWPQINLAPRCETPIEHYLAMVDGLLDSPPEYNGFAGYLLGRCRPVLTDHPSLIWETVAICCSRAQGFMAGYLVGATGDRVLTSASASLAAEFASAWGGHCSGELEEESLQRILNRIFLWRAKGRSDSGDLIIASTVSVLDQAFRIADPYLQFRAVSRLLDTVGREEEIPLSLDALGLVEEMSEQHDQSRALEWIMMTIPDKQIGLGVAEIFFLDALVGSFARIADPEDRARAQCRLALLADERLEELVGAMAGSIEQIADPQQRAEAISDVRSVLGAVPSLIEALDALADALPEPWLRNKGRRRASRLVATYRLDYGTGALAWRLPPDAQRIGASSCRLSYPTGNLAWGVLYLNATAAEVAGLEAARTGSEAHWDLLLSSEPGAGVDGLVESAADGGLRLTAGQASVLNRAIQSGRAEALKPLWAYLESPDAGAMAIAARWTAADEEAKRWTALVQVEAGRLTPDNVGPVVELTASSADRLRVRAALALHGRTPYVKNPNRRWHVAQVGAKAIEAIAWHAGRGEYPPPVRSSLSWAAHDIHHDDGEAVSHWLSEAAEKSDSPVHWILEHMESIDPGLVSPLLVSLPSAPPRLQRSLLFGLARLAHCGDALSGRYDEVQSAVAEIPAEIRRQVSAVSGGPVTYLKVAAQVAAEHGEDSRLEAARSLIEDATLWLDDACLGPVAMAVNRLKGIGNDLYVLLGEYGYRASANDAAESLAGNEDALKLLLSLAESLSLAEGSDKRIGDLLTAIDALAHVSPDAFTALADPDIWESILAQWVEAAEHWTIRLAAVRLLGLLRRVTERVAAALRAAMSDVSFVQQAAYHSVGEFRRMKGDIIPQLLGLLDDPSAAVAASTARLLVSVARAEGATADRRRVLHGLQDAVTRSPRVGAVYLMHEGEDEGRMSMQYVDRLDRILYRAIFEVSGL